MAVGCGSLLNSLLSVAEAPNVFFLTIYSQIHVLHLVLLILVTNNLSTHYSSNTHQHNTPQSQSI